MTANELADGLRRLGEIMEKAEFRSWGKWCNDAAKEITEKESSYIDGRQAMARLGAMYDTAVKSDIREAMGIDDAYRLIEEMIGDGNNDKD